MSTPNDPQDQIHQAEPVDDLMLTDDEPQSGPDRERLSSSVRDIASRIPESLSSIGRDISRTIERALAAKDDYVVAVKVSHEAQDKLEQLVQAGVFRSRAEAAAFLIDEGIKAQTKKLFDRVARKALRDRAPARRAARHDQQTERRRVVKRSESASIFLSRLLLTFARRFTCPRHAAAVRSSSSRWRTACASS